MVSLPKLLTLGCDPSYTFAFVLLSGIATKVALKTRSQGRTPYLVCFHVGSTELISPEKVLTSLVVFSRKPYREKKFGASALGLLDALHPLTSRHLNIYNKVGQLWRMVILQMLKTLDDHTEQSLNQEEWEGMLLWFLHETLVATKNDHWVERLIRVILERINYSSNDDDDKETVVCLSEDSKAGSHSEHCECQDGSLHGVSAAQGRAVGLDRGASLEAMHCLELLKIVPILALKVQCPGTRLSPGHTGQAFLYKAFGFSLRASSHENLLRTMVSYLLRTSHEELQQREGIAVALSILSTRHLEIVLEELEVCRARLTDSDSFILKLSELRSFPGRAAASHTEPSKEHQQREWVLLCYTVYLSYSKIILESDGAVFVHVDAILALVMQHYHDCVVKKDENVKLDNLNALAILTDTLSSPQHLAFQLEFPYKLTIVTCMVELIREEPLTSISSPIRQKAMTIISNFRMLRPLLGIEERVEILQTCFGSVLFLPATEVLQKEASSPEEAQANVISSFCVIVSLVLFTFPEDEKILRPLFRIEERVKLLPVCFRSVLYLPATEVLQKEASSPEEARANGQAPTFRNPSWQITDFIRFWARPLSSVKGEREKPTVLAFVTQVLLNEILQSLRSLMEALVLEIPTWIENCLQLLDRWFNSQRVYEERALWYAARILDFTAKMDNFKMDIEFTRLENLVMLLAKRCDPAASIRLLSSEAVYQFHGILLRKKKMQRETAGLQEDDGKIAVYSANIFNQNTFEIAKVFAEFFTQTQLTNLVLMAEEDLTDSRAPVSLASAQLMSAVTKERGTDIIELEHDTEKETLWAMCSLAGSNTHTVVPVLLNKRKAGGLRTEGLWCQAHV
ncbi:LOW QUALITY PROTEIN: maestro heat-like repeat family member 5 [Rhynchonycteris naso]